MFADNAQKGISVIICCYNSATRLYETLKHLALQKTNASLHYEIIIVDNASTDNTIEFASETWDDFKKNDVAFKTVSEKQQGLSFARQRGVKTARYEYIIFVDDDNWLDENYLQTAYNLISTNKSIGAAGGQSTGVSDVEFPAWFAECAEAYSVCKQGTATGVINDKGYVCGAGMITRKTVFQNAVNKNFPSILTDRKGNALSAGGDCEYCFRLILQGYNIYYDEDLKFKHYIPSYRLTEEYRKALFKGVEEAQLILKEYFEATKIKRLSRYNKIKLFGNAIKDFIKSFLRKRRPQPSSYKLFFYFFNIGFSYSNDLRMIKQFYNSKSNFLHS